MSLFRWIEDKLEQVDPVTSSTDSPSLFDRDKLTKETQALQEQVLQLKSDLRTSRNYAELQLAVSHSQAKDTACSDEINQVRELLQAAEHRAEVAERENEGLRSEAKGMKIESQEAFIRAERLQAILESGNNALAQGDESETVGRLRIQLE